MKKNIYLTLFISLFFASHTLSQGMYIPSLLDSSVMADMSAKGCKLSAKDIYDFNNGSLKDAVLQFNGGCTGEIISDKGLLLTNHHCGLGQIQQHSTIQNDYLTNGFWAKSMNEELPCEGLTVTFIIRIDDVTDSIIPFLKKANNETTRQDIVDSISIVLNRNATYQTHYESFVRAFYNGNQYFRFIIENFKDVRLVGAPPICIGNFGGDTDNWMWPRHTGDFSMFRIYANDKNEPAEYSKDNVPFKPRRSLLISAKGLNEGDFTMVYGFPGRTQQYLCSDAVDLIQNYSDPISVKVRTLRLSTWGNAMRSNDTIRIQYQAKYNGVANAWKKWQGEILGLQQTRVIEKKKLFEEEISKKSIGLIPQKLTLGDRLKYENVEVLLKQMSVLYDSTKKYQSLLNYTNEALLAPEIFRYAEAMYDLYSYLQDENIVISDSLKQALKNNATGFFANYNAGLDEAVMKNLFPMYLQNVPVGWQPEYLKTSLAVYKNNSDVMIKTMYEKSMLTKLQSMNSFFDKLSRKTLKKLVKDPLYLLAMSCFIEAEEVQAKYSIFNSQLLPLNRRYMKAQLNLYPEKNLFPDANSTLRVAYGNIKPYEPRDGVKYNWFTTSTGILEKYYSKAAEDYVLIPQFKELLEKKDFGVYADKDGTLHTDFIASNHTTGGNSGSPVLNAKGELIGINFDRVWEGTMSDINFDTTRCRNIALDVRYFLFIVDKLGKAGYLIDEMKIVR
jgi:hypothetical protein